LFLFISLTKSNNLVEVIYL
ncbi:hypothetical protein FOXB_05740, partial [Fusarium oxysporum f. sp. conglutinans Fo5176]